MRGLIKGEHADTKEPVPKDSTSQSKTLPSPNPLYDVVNLSTDAAASNPVYFNHLALKPADDSDAECYDILQRQATVKPSKWKDAGINGIICGNLAQAEYSHLGKGVIANCKSDDGRIHFLLR